MAGNTDIVPANRISIKLFGYRKRHQTLDGPVGPQASERVRPDKFSNQGVRHLAVSRLLYLLDRNASSFQLITDLQVTVSNTC